ncbi:MAG: carboxymuconolactone decarboxylase family protein [Casimicrobiaceae bacterium]
MARVADVGPEALSPEVREIYERFGSGYGPFKDQVAVFAHVPSALQHVMGMLLELRAQKNVPYRYIELAIVAVSKLNECHYCVGHHKPLLLVEGLSSEGADSILDYAQHPELDDVDRLVVEYAIGVTNNPQRIRDGLFDRLRRHFSEPQIVELTLRIALCGFFNRFNDALQIDGAYGAPGALHPPEDADAVAAHGR